MFTNTNRDNVDRLKKRSYRKVQAIFQSMILVNETVLLSIENQELNEVIEELEKYLSHDEQSMK